MTPSGQKCTSAVSPILGEFKYLPNTCYSGCLDKDWTLTCEPGFHFYSTPSAVTLGHGMNYSVTTTTKSGNKVTEWRPVPGHNSLADLLI